MRFEYYFDSTKNAKFIIGNSSSGVRELFSISSIYKHWVKGLKGRNKAPTQIDCDNSESSMVNSIIKVKETALVKSKIWRWGSC